MFGYGIGISDTRVTLEDGSEHDCLQKIYPVGKSIAIGFAGSVAIGFGMVKKFTELLRIADSSLAWNPEIVADWWPADAREVFNSFPHAERNLQSHIILIGVHPNNPGFAKSYAYKFCSPDFTPTIAKPRQLIAIGCGTGFEPCRQAVESLSTEHETWFSVMQGEQGVRGGMLTLLGFKLTLILKGTQPRGISSHLHYCWVYRDRIVIAPNDHAELGRWHVFGTGVDAAERALNETTDARKGAEPSLVTPSMKTFRMPRIANSLIELEEILSNIGAAVARATA